MANDKRGSFIFTQNGAKPLGGDVNASLNDCRDR